MYKKLLFHGYELQLIFFQGKKATSRRNWALSKGDHVFWGSGVALLMVKNGIKTANMNSPKSGRNTFGMMEKYLSMAGVRLPV